MSVERHLPSSTQRTEPVDDAGGDQDVAEALRPDKPYDTKTPNIRTTTAQCPWLKARKASEEWEDMMCESWRSRINVMTILAGVYCYTATMLTLQTYKLLHETPADVLARVQLQSQFNEGHDPTMTDRMTTAVTTHRVSPSAVLVNVLFVASLGLSLTTFGVGLLCKQWLREYERCETPAAKESCLVRGLHFPGLRAWRAPTVIAFLPVLLQGVVLLFFIGIHILFWSIHPLVGSLVAIGEVVVVLGVAVVLCPALLRN